MNVKKYDVGVIGGGAAGMMAAIAASSTGKSVVLIEKNHFLGKKVLATGNGRCNLTNKNINVDRYHGADPNFVKNILSQFDQNLTMNFFEKLGLLLKEEDNGRIFPRTNQASSVVTVLEQKLIENKVDLMLGREVKNIEKTDNFEVIFGDGSIIYCSNLIIVTGGKAAHFLGSSGDGLFWAQKLGHNILPIHAALVPVETEESWTKDVQGVRLVAKVALKLDSKIISESTGDLLFTHFGLSGPAVMSLAREIKTDGHYFFQIDLFPDLDTKVLDQKVSLIFANNGKKSIKNALVGILPSSIIDLVLKISNVNGDRKAAEISKIDRLNLVSLMKCLVLNIKGLRPLKEAQVTAGGVDTTQIDQNTLESKIVKGLYFAGEVLDVDADSGGFNLQWAWSSGHVAGSSCLIKN